MTKPKNKRAHPVRRRSRPKPSASHSRVDFQSDIATALQLQQSGDLGAARQIYCNILDQDPRNADAWHLMGMALFAGGQMAEAVECLQNADSIVPGHPEVLANLGVILRGMGELEQAKIVLEQSIAANPKSPAARNNLGTVLMELSQLDDAATQFQTALEHDPSFDNASMNLGNVWQRQGRLRDAESLYQEVLRRNPNDALALNNLGETLRNQGRWPEAAQSLERSLALSPDSVETQINLGRVLLNQYQHQEAQDQFSRLIADNPTFAKPHHYLGKALFELGDMPGAAHHIEHALQLDPSDIYARSSLGFVYLEMGRSEEAADCFRDVVRHDTTMSEAHGCLLFVMSGDADKDQEELFEEHRRWGIQHGDVKPLGPHTLVRTRDRRLRIGYVSPDFCHHAVARFFRPVLESHDPNCVETFCYSEVAKPDEMTKRLQDRSDHWRPTKGLSNEQVARQIEADAIDILVDLAGHTSGNRLQAFAYRPAPIQVTWMGYPNTTGLESIDYRLTCATQNPIDEPSYHTETLVRMPNGSFCFSAPLTSPDVSSLPAIRNGHITFGSLHRPFKISPSTRDLWADVMLACPDSRLLVFNTRFTDETTEALLNDLGQRGVRADRIEIRNAFEGNTYLDVYQEIDIALDVAPWAGGTTTMESLWMGVPVMALNGNRRSARSTAAIMKNCGHPALIATTPESYVRLATELANDVPRLTILREAMRNDVQQTLFNAPRFTRELENEFRTMWTRWCDSSDT